MKIIIANEFSLKYSFYFLVPLRVGFNNELL